MIKRPWSCLQVQPCQQSLWHRMQTCNRPVTRGPLHADRYNHASKAAVENAHVDPAFRAVMEDRLLELGSHFGIEDFFSGWFRDAPFESIRCALLDKHGCRGRPASH